MPTKRNPLSPEGRKLLAKERGRIARRQGRLGEAINTAARLGDASLDANEEREAAFVRGVVRNVEAVLASERIVVPAKVTPGAMSARTTSSRSPCHTRSCPTSVSRAPCCAA